VAVQDPQDQQQPPLHPNVQRLITAAQTGAVVRAAGAATVAPSVAVAAPAIAAGKIVSGATEGLAHAVKIALVLRILRRLMQRRRIESVSTLEATLRKRFPGLDPTVIRRIVEQEIKYEDAFDRKATKRVEADLQKVGQLDKDAQAKRIAEILAREKHYGVLRERAMWARAIGHAENEVVRLASPLGAKWVLGAAKNHSLGCLALAGKNWPWAVLDTIPPPIHTGCQCSLQPLGPNDTVPLTGEAMSMARRAMALEEAITAVADAGEVEAFLAGEAIRPSIARAICELREFSYEEALHPRGRGGRWMAKLGAKRIELKGEKKLTERQTHAAVKKVAEGVADFYGGDKAAVEAHHEPQYMADVGGVARFRHPGELLAGINYGQRVMDTVRDPEYGVHDLRIVAHEAAHSLSGTRPGPLPGFSQAFEEGGAEVLSLWFWHHRAQHFDERDAARLSGKWTKPGADSLAHSVVYRAYVEELMRRAASKVGWNRTELIDEIERVMRGDHTVRLKFRDATDPEFPLPKDLPDMQRAIGREEEGDHAVPLVRWLVSEPAKLQEAFEGRLHPRDRYGKFAVTLKRLHTLTRADVERGDAPGISMRDQASGVAGRASLEGIQIAPSAVDASGHVSSVLIAHEAGHYLVPLLIKDGKIPDELKAFEAGSGRAAGRYGATAGNRSHLFSNPWKAGERDLPEEMLADAYSALLHGEGEFEYIPGIHGPDDPESRKEEQDRFEASPKTKLLKRVAEVAREMSWPDKGTYRYEASGPMHDRRYELRLREAAYTEALHPRERTGRWMFHLAPKGARADIEKNGIDSVKGMPIVGNKPMVSRGNYLWDRPEGVQQMYAPSLHDIWAVDARGLSLEPDPEGIGAAVLTKQKIPPERVRRIEVAELNTKLQEAHWTEFLHPRGRRGQWVDAIQHAIPEREREPEPEREGFTGEDFAKALDGFSHGGITTVRQNRTKTQHLYGEVWLGLHKPGKSEPVGLARVTLKPPNNRGVRVAEYSNIYLTGAEQNKGFGRAFTDHLFKTLRDGGVDKISIEAVSIGGYAWARRGFVWTGDKAAEQRRILQDAKNDGRWERMQGHLPESHYAEFERKLQAGEFSSESELAAYGIDFPWDDVAPPEVRGAYDEHRPPVRTRTWLGKELLIGSRWKGNRPVTVTAST
jgi:hypothetical protein